MSGTRRAVTSVTSIRDSREHVTNASFHGCFASSYNILRGLVCAVASVHAFWEDALRIFTNSKKRQLL